MEKIPTAEVIFKNNIPEEYKNEGYSYGDINPVWINRAMIEFAKLHIRAALKIASNEASVTDETILSSQEGSIYEIDKDSILNAYNLDNIK